MQITVVHMQVHAPFTGLHHATEGMGSPQGGGMGGASGQALHAPAAIRPTAPPPSQGPSLGSSSPLPESIPAGPHPVMPMPTGMGVSVAMAVMPIASTMPGLSTGVAGTVGHLVGTEQPPKRKRGRPRKYSGTELSPGLNLQGAPGASPLSSHAMPISSSSSPYTPSPEKRGRGRPPGSGKKQQLAALGVVLAGTGQGFTPHILTVDVGEDVATKIMQFAQHGPRAICVLSANGAISNVTLRQQSSSGGTVTYEGRFEILSLSGSYLPTDVGGGARQRTGGLSVSLAGNDGRVIGGGVAGMLTAASPIQVVVGSFLSDAHKTQSKSDSPLGLAQGGTSGGSSFSTPGSHRPPAPKHELKGSTAGPQQALPAPSSAGQPSGQRPQGFGMFQPQGSWPSPSVLGDGRRTDINISLPGG